MFEKILVANRGEIAQRIFVACQELGIRSVAIYSEVDAGAPWIWLADESYPLSGVAASETYLNQEAVFDVARTCRADAIHPGYGFLSENADFAAACEKHGITFIGPSPESMRLLGNKAEARILAERTGVPIVPGVDGSGKSDDDLIDATAAIGYPVLIKASAGGGGKGMRVVWSADEFLDALYIARSEAASSFGDDHILVEKFFTKIHHVEIQVLGDGHGNLLHLFERECSIQRRHQKIIEESPAPVIRDNQLRQEMATAAVRLTLAAGYENAGTVEFIVDENGRFYFLEMNTRLQVEHPVTEMVTGLDLAVWQIRIAAGEALPFSQEKVRQRGHAIECRVYAEDPSNNFFPSTGKLLLYSVPEGPGLRIDDGIEAGMEITPYYDPMLAKVITWGHDRDEAVRKMVRALREMIIMGVTTNIPYLLSILREPHFLAGQTPTDYIDDWMADWQPQETIGDEAWLGAAVFELLQGGGKSKGSGTVVSGEVEDQPDPWKDLASWRNVQT
ncbi:MAG: acetyl-CoA carboxylase biotin carboxylase subunit [Chloroflexi bacterium]|jgi:acetyl-CoA carboxylase biotin carboxylase subunit|nr:acetyl-CoA carboxylase biotin carboxylase subunit [Chloroflexota bacterium]